MSKQFFCSNRSSLYRPKIFLRFECLPQVFLPIEFEWNFQRKLKKLFNEWSTELFTTSAVFNLETSGSVMILLCGFSVYRLRFWHTDFPGFVRGIFYYKFVQSFKTPCHTNPQRLTEFIL